jgi:hypothetical protein
MPLHYDEYSAMSSHEQGARKAVIFAQIGAQVRTFMPFNLSKN